jgi:hypothetical protein
MKKLITAIFFLMTYMNASYAELGINVGISGQMGLFTATAKEVDTGPNITETTQDSEIGAAGFASIFIEKTLGDLVSVGIDYVPSALTTDTVETSKLDQTTGAGATRTAVTNKLKVDFEDLTTYYVALNVTENLYLKAGMTTVDVITKEDLGTGSTYGDTNLDGTLLGVGYNKSFDNTMFVRVEGNYMSFDSASVTSSNTDNVVTLKNLDGVTGKISIGKSF